MNPQTLAEAKKLFLEVKNPASRQKGVDVVVAPPAVFLPELRGVYSGSKIRFGVQDVFWRKKGSYTGEISAKQAKEAGASYAILGHSERRALGETSQEVSKKVDAVLREGMRPVLCVGEENRDSHGEYLNFLHEELKESLGGISAKRAVGVVVAYEPIWAIGKEAKDAIDSHELHAMIVLIRKSLAKIYNKKTAMKVKIIYGGSVEPANTEELWKSGTAGFLVGHASLNSKQFIEIVKSAP